MAPALDRDRILQAFEALGADLAEWGSLIEIAVEGGGGLMLQFAWRRGTDDIDAVVREGFDETALAPSIQRVAERMGLPADWLNNAVGMVTPLDEDERGCSWPPAAIRPTARRACARCWPSPITWSP